MRVLRWLGTLPGERGITGIETAVVIGGLVAASSLFAGVALRSGVAGSRQLDTAVQAALRQTTTGVQVDGPVIAQTDGTHATRVLVDVTTTAGGGAVVLAAGMDVHDATPGLAVTYVSDSTVQHGVPYTVAWLNGDGDGELEAGEVAEIAVDLSVVTPPAGAGDQFTLELRAGDAAPLDLTRRLPAGRPLDAVTLLW